MNYQVWTHDEYTGWIKVECGDLPAVKREVLEALKQGKDPMVTVEVPYDVNIKVMEDKIGEVTPRKTKHDKSPRDTGDSKVRPGNEGAAEPVSESLGDPGAGPGAGN